MLLRFLEPCARRALRRTGGLKRRDLPLELDDSGAVGQGLPAGLRESDLAVGESSVILLHPPLPLVGVSMKTMGECQQNDSPADGESDLDQRERPLLLLFHTSLAIGETVI